MSIQKVAILSPGDMGHAVGRAFIEKGLEAITCLQGRSDRTRTLAERAAIRDVPTMEDLVTQADLVLSILVPAEALSVAKRVADALKTTGSDTAFADCNATSPQTALAIDGVITAARGRSIDASIIGGPPGRGSPPRFYVSGPDADIMSQLDGKGIAVRQLGEEIGRASGIKMCYAALTKGTSALYTALLIAAEALDLSEPLAAEFASSQGDAYNRMQAQVPSLPANAFRWIGEMEEIAATFEQVGVTPYFHRGAAEMFRLLSETPFAEESPETMDKSRTLEQTVSGVHATLASRVGGTD